MIYVKVWFIADEQLGHDMNFHIIRIACEYHRGL